MRKRDDDMFKDCNIEAIICPATYPRISIANQFLDQFDEVNHLAGQYNFFLIGLINMRT